MVDIYKILKPVTKGDGWNPFTILDYELEIPRDSWKWHATYTWLYKLQENKAPKFCNEQWFLSSKYALEHFVYTAKMTPSKMAFAESETKGKKDIQTVIKVGRYLNRYFSDVLSADEIKVWANLHRKENVDYELKFAETEEEIEFVYETGPNSCMSGPACSFEETKGIHPARVYAGPDTKIAYIERNGNITARCVVIEKGSRKEYINSIYGDGDVLRDYLEDAGYESSDDGLEDCRLLLLKNSNNNVIMPYLDGYTTNYDIGTKYITVTNNGGYCAESTNGMGGDYQSCFCEYCDESYEEGSGDYLSSVGVWVCDNCQGESFTEALDIYGDYTLCPNEDIVEAYDGTLFKDWSAAYENEYYECEETERLYPVAGMVETSNGWVCTESSIEVVDTDGTTYYDMKSNASDYYFHEGKYYESDPTEEEEDD